MECNNNLRHVCFKDLDDYIERDKYFSDFTEEEIAVIRKNLGIDNKDDDGYDPTVVVGTYNEIYNQVIISDLKVGYKYLIKDFRSIYQDEDGKVCGTDAYIPSKEYMIFLTPTSTSTFDKRVQLAGSDLLEDSPSTWTVEYDISKKTFEDGTSNKGTITYLKDNNNNYAYYDFKNIKFKKKAELLQNLTDNYKQDTYFYTFDNEGIDASLTCKNNHLEYGAYGNVFLGNAQNVTLAENCHDNIFFKNCENCSFECGTYDNYFLVDTIRCKGYICDETLDNDLLSFNSVKYFLTIEGEKAIMVIDLATLTNQIIIIPNG